MTRIVVPDGAAQQWLGSELVTPSNPAGLTAGTLVGSVLQLTDNNDAGGTPPNTGLAWPVGRHRVVFKVNAVSDFTLDWAYRIRNITDSTYAVEVNITNDLGGGNPRSVALEFDSVAGKSYQPQVVKTGGAFRVDVLDITHTFIPFLAQDDQFHSEPDNQVVHRRDSSGNLLTELETEGEVPFDVPPGLTAIFVVPLDIPRPGYKEPESVKGRTLTVSVKGAPRYVG